MKNSELINFIILLETITGSIVKNKDSYFPKALVNFNEKTIFEQEITNSLTKIEFAQECFFGKQRLIIDADPTIKLKRLKVNGITFENFPNKEIICKQPKKGTYIFEFECPYAYYFINRWVT